MATLAIALQRYIPIGYSYLDAWSDVYKSGAVGNIGRESNEELRLAAFLEKRALIQTAHAAVQAA